MQKLKFNNTTTIKITGDLSHGYTVITNNIMNDIERLGVNAFTVLSKILQYANSPTHTVSLRGLESQLPLSVNTISKAIKRLIELGYVKRKAIKNGNLIIGYDYEVTTSPTIETVENANTHRNHKNCDSDRIHKSCDIGECDDKKKINKKENKKIDEESENYSMLLQLYFDKYQLSTKRLSHIKELLLVNANKFEVNLWNEIFISASEDNVKSKYKYVKAIIEDLIKDNIYTLEEYKKRKADSKKPTTNPNNSIRQNKEKYTGNYKKNEETIPFTNNFANEKPKTKFHNCNSHLGNYTPEELEQMLLEGQKEKGMI